MVFYIQRFRDVESREFEVEVVTPLFLGGADPKKAELRAPSIKGMLRFWWRAVHAHLPLRKLKDQESMTFGDAGSLYGKSKVQLSIISASAYDGTGKQNPVPHKAVKFSFQCFNPGQKFVLRIIGEESVFDLFHLVSILGGLGKRSRRGFGSFRITRVDGEELKSEPPIKRTMALLQNLAENIFVKTADKNKIVRKDKLAAEYAYIKTIEIGARTAENWREVLKRIGQSSHTHNSDYTGFAKGKKRFSSPVFVSVVKHEDSYIPIITTLNTAFKQNGKTHGEDKSSQFKRYILSGGLK